MVIILCCHGAGIPSPALLDIKSGRFLNLLVTSSSPSTSGKKSMIVPPLLSPLSLQPLEHRSLDTATLIRATFRVRYKPPADTSHYNSQGSSPSPPALPPLDGYTPPYILSPCIIRPGISGIECIAYLDHCPWILILTPLSPVWTCICARSSSALEGNHEMSLFRQRVEGSSTPIIRSQHGCIIYVSWLEYPGLLLPHRLVHK